MNLTTGRPALAQQPALTVPKPSRTLRAADLPAALRRQIPLSDRKLDVLLLTRAVLCNKEIGRTLGISGRTAEVHKQQARGAFNGASLMFMVLMLDRLLHKEGL